MRTDGWTAGSRLCKRLGYNNSASRVESNRDSRLSRDGHHCCHCWPLSAAGWLVGLRLSLLPLSLYLLLLLLFFFFFFFLFGFLSIPGPQTRAHATPLQTTTHILVEEKEKKERERLHACLYLCVYRLCVSTILDYSAAIYCGL